MSAARLLPCILLLLGAALCRVAAAAETTDPHQLDRLFGRSELQIATADAQLHTFKVWVADTDARRERGLMFVRAFPADAGMLFVYPRVQQIAMWMKNTYLPLDMLFVRADGRIERVVENTQPLSLETIASGAAVLAVIELNGGSAARLKIRAGAQVIHPAFAAR
jgi:uncharacterized protein